LSHRAATWIVTNRASCYAKRVLNVIAESISYVF
jgi:hypothetical protein